MLSAGVVDIATIGIALLPSDTHLLFLILETSLVLVVAVFALNKAMSVVLAIYFQDFIQL